ncbi:uncharacterized protein K02A2.6-like [Dreissena polymorpha]|nr:uncharacterized protein K02A2.6-like [Dreissena polymorpha]
MRDENREMKRMLQRLLASSATDDEPMQLPENISLPIGTFEQMDEFEEHIWSLTSPAKPSEKTYKELCDLLSTHLSPKPLIIAERFRFHKRNQATGECIKDLVETLRKIEDIFANLSHGQKYSKLDLRQAYLQLEVDDGSKELLTINTHQGLYRYNRYVYGISSLPAIWQRTIDQILQGIPGVQCILADMIVTGDSDQSHLDNLEKVLCRLNEFGLKLNKDKCVFFEDRVTYCGHEIDKDGLSKCNDNVQAVIDTPTPKDPSGNCKDERTSSELCLVAGD